MQPCKQIRKNLKNRLPIPPSLFQGTKNIHDSISKNFTSPTTDPTGKTSFPNANIQKTFQTSKKSHTFFQTGYPVVQSYLVEDDALDALHVLRFDGYSELFPLPKTGKSFMPIGCIRFFPSAAKQQQDGGYSSFAGSALTGTTKEQKEGAPKINGAPPYGWK